MSAASFLGISAAVFATGFDGLIYSIGFLVGWPIVTVPDRRAAAQPRQVHLRRCRRLPASTQTPIRIFAASGTLVVVAFYLIAQMVGAGQLIKLLFGLDYCIAVVIVGALMMVYVLFGGMTATTWVQIIKACLLLAGATFMAFMVLLHFGFSPEAMFAKAVEVKPACAAAARRRRGGDHGARSWARAASSRTRSRRSRFGMALMFGTAGLPHILMRFFTVPDAKEARKSVFWATGLDRLLLHPDLHHRLRRHHLRADQPGVHSTRDGVIKLGIGRQQHGGHPPGQCGRRQRVPRLHLGGGLRHHPRGGRRPDAVGRLGGRRTTSTPTVIKKGKADERDGAAASRSITTVVLGIVAIMLGIVFEKQNIAFMVALAFAIAASAQLPGAADVGAVEGLHHHAAPWSAASSA